MRLGHAVGGPRAPIYDEWRQALLDYYKEAYGHHSPQYRAALPGPRGYSNGNFEPRVAREVIEALVARETRIRVLRNAIPRAVRAEGRRIAAVDFERLDGGGLVHGDRAGFADGSYEGDLMALAGCGYRTGREGTDEYGGFGDCRQPQVVTRGDACQLLFELTAPP